MIIQCDQCSAKFRLDDSKLKEGGAKVRCSKCKHIFVVQREAPAEEADFDSLLNGLVPPSPDMSKEVDAVSSPDMGQFAAAAGEPSQTELPGTEEKEGGGFAENGGFDFGEFNFDEGPVSAPPAASSGTEEKGGFEFGEFDLEKGDSAGREEEVPGQGIPSFDENTFSFAEEQAPPVPEIEIKIEGEEFSFEPEAAAPIAAPSLPEPEKGGEQPAPFDVGEFEFDEAAASEEPEKGETIARKPEEWVWDKPESQTYEQIAAPPAYGQNSAPDISVPSMAEEELPPLSISSRRKGSSILPIVVTAICVLLVLALAGGGFYFFKEGPSALNKVGLGFMVKWIGLETREEGGIAIRNPGGAFLNNNEAGEIFVINGEAVNNFVKPRASIQVKATLYGSKGEVLLQKSAYCGNAISKEQLVTLPVAKLEAAMGNQFGDSLSNLAVQPGKGIPFVVVFTNVPKDTAEFGVEVAGSTVASQ